MSDFEQKFKELEAKFKESLSSNQKLLEEIEKLKNTDKTTPDQTQKELHADIKKLHKFISDDCINICKNLQARYKKNPHDIFNRRSFQISILGIIWTEAIEGRYCDKIVTSSSDIKQIIEPTIDFDECEGAWSDLDPLIKDAILDWLQNYRYSPNVKPEALISENIWGFLVRKLLISIESSCKLHDHTNRLQCFPEYNCKNISAIGAHFFTDFVFTCGSLGLPVFFAELAATANAELHKDIKKLAVQMAGALFHLIGRIRTSQNEEAISFLSKLRKFGALISGSRVEFAVARPIFNQNDQKFKIIFETHQSSWSFDIFGQPRDYKEEKSEVESEDVIMEAASDLQVELEIDYEDFADDPEENFEPSEGNGSVGDATIINIKALEALTFFLKKVHSYYATLPESIKSINLNPEKFKGDPQLCYPPSIHKTLNISSKPTPQLKISEIIELKIIDSPVRTHKACLTQFSFPTLPAIYNIEPNSADSDDNYRNVLYYSGLSLPEVEGMIQPVDDNDEEELISTRVYMRSVFILDILMAIYKAFEAGIVFLEFDIDDFTFRAGHFCIKNYRAALPSNDFEALKRSISKFSNFYYRIYLMETIFTEGEPEYRLLEQIASLAFRRIRKHSSGQFNWEGLFRQAIIKFEGILEQCNVRLEDSSTLSLLNQLLPSYSSSISASASSSVETMPIGIQGPQEKLTSTIKLKQAPFLMDNDNLHEII